MILRRVLFASVPLAVCLATTAPAAAQAQPPASRDATTSATAEAEVHFKRGVSLYQESDFRAALVEFRRAYELGRNWRLLYNVGQAEYQTRDYAAALASFETFLREGGERIPKSRRADIEQEIARLRMRVGKITVRASVPGALVLVDDEALGSVPLTRSVSVGGKRIVVKHDGYQPWVRSIEVASGDDLVFDAVLEPVPGAVVPSNAGIPAAPEGAPRAPVTHRFPWESWAVTGVLGAAALTTGILALTSASKLDDEKNRFDVTDADLDSASSRVKTFSVLSDVFLVATLAAAGTSLFFTLKPTPPFSASLRFTPTASGGVVTGCF